MRKDNDLLPEAIRILDNEKAYQEKLARLSQSNLEWFVTQFKSTYSKYFVEVIEP